MEDFGDDLFDNYDFDVPSSQPTQTTQPQRLNTFEPEKAIEPEIKASKLDEKLLLETNGLPLLKNESKYLNFMGEGHEEQDLNKLMAYYGEWANKLYPKVKFQDFVKRVGRAASDKSVTELISNWQEEYREKLKVKRDFMNELSGKTVGDDEGIIRQDDSSDDDEQRPLFIPFSSDTPRKQKTTQSKKAAATTKKRNTYHSDDDEESQPPPPPPPQTITFSDDEENERTPVKSGREYALAILAEKRKKRKLAQQKIQQQEEEEEEEANAIETTALPPSKPTDISTDEYYGEDIQLALSDNELLSLNIIPPPTTQEKQSELENNEHKMTDLDSEMHDI